MTHGIGPFVIACVIVVLTITELRTAPRSYLNGILVGASLFGLWLLSTGQVR